MLDVLKFIFSDFWHFAGTYALLWVVAFGISGMFRRRED